MGGFSVDDEGKRENGDTQHRRSKSASEKKWDTEARSVGKVTIGTVKLDNSKGGVLHVKKERKESHDLPPLRRNFRGQGVVQDQHNGINTKVPLTNRASLENDIEQLQLRLQQEKSMRIMLERAMGRASSTLSPGHRHFAAQTKELITEIELLEEEVANREQHVLSLYRSIFEQCASRPQSKQSSRMASPAHIKHDSRKQKHPSIISSAFCSSKKFLLRSFHSFVSTNESGKRASLTHSKSRHASVLSGSTDIQFEKIYSEPAKAQEKISKMEKNSHTRTLKNHLH